MIKAVRMCKSVNWKVFKGHAGLVLKDVILQYNMEHEDPLTSSTIVSVDRLEKGVQPDTDSHYTAWRFLVSHVRAKFAIIRLLLPSPFVNHHPQLGFSSRGTYAHTDNKKSVPSGCARSISIVRRHKAEKCRGWKYICPRILLLQPIWYREPHSRTTPVRSWRIKCGSGRRVVSDMFTTSCSCYSEIFLYPYHCRRVAPQSSPTQNSVELWSKPFIIIIFLVLVQSFPFRAIEFCSHPIQEGVLWAYSE